jgi:signal transduction histidine kinase
MNGSKIASMWSGAISVTCSATRDRVEIHVRDNGPGIAPDHMEAIFEPFMQVRPHSIGERDGVGLGLAISRQLARGMGGDLTGESVVGEGSVFVCSLPRAS